MGITLFDSRTALEPLRPRIDEAIAGVIDDGAFILGPNVEAFEAEFAAATGSPHAVGVANGTEAITIALRALGVGAGDEVVVPSFTYFASAEAIPALGAVPVFCDVDPESFVSTAEHVRAAMTPRTKAVVAVHLFGNVAPVREIEALGVPVVEDTAQAAGSTGPDGRPGALGTIATHSFYPSKNLGAFGDGGAITTADAALAERVRMLRFHGSRDKVVYEEAAYNSRLDEIQAAVLRVMLPELEGWAAGRRAAGERYAAALEGVVGLPQATPGAAPAWHLFVIRTPDPDALAEGLAGRGIESRGYYRTPVHLQPAMACWDGAGADLPGTAEAARTHLAVPVSATITAAQVDEVAGAIQELLG